VPEPSHILLTYGPNLPAGHKPKKPLLCSAFSRVQDLGASQSHALLTALQFPYQRAGCSSSVTA